MKKKLKEKCTFRLQRLPGKGCLAHDDKADDSWRGQALAEGIGGHFMCAHQDGFDKTWVASLDYDKNIVDQECTSVEKRRGWPAIRLKAKGLALADPTCLWVFFLLLAARDRLPMMPGSRFDSGRKSVNSNEHGFEQVDPLARVLNYCFQ